MNAGQASAGDTRLADAFLAACALDVAAAKPGNVSAASPGHGMTAADFLASASASAAWVTDFRLGIGERVFRAVAATRAAVACNTNLGILLLAVPLLDAARRRPPGAPLAACLGASLAAFDLEQTEWVYRAIRLAAPGGLGGSDRHDVRAAADAPLARAMAEAAGRDRIARQYASGYADLYAVGLPALAQGRALGGSEEAALTEAFMAFLAAFPDSHIVRGHGAGAAAAVCRAAQACQARRALGGDPEAGRQALDDLDRQLKSAGLNPGTSADLSVAAWLAERLDAGAARHTSCNTRPVGERLGAGRPREITRVPASQRRA